MTEVLKAFLGTWKNQLIGILVVALLAVGYVGYRSLNKKIGEYQNEIIPLEQTNTPDPSMFDGICLYVTDQPCP